MKKLFNFISVVALLAFFSCGGATFITPDKNSVDFAIEGGEQTVNISTDGTWELMTSPDWVQTEVKDSVLVLKTTRNETGAVRKGDVVLKGKEGVETTIKVTQATKCTHITPAKDKVAFEKEGGKETVDIDTDGEIQVKSEAFETSYENGVLTVTALANDGGAKRGEIVLTCEDQMATIQVSQKGNICSKCGGSGKVRCSKCGGKGFTHKAETQHYGIDYGCANCGGGGNREYNDGWIDLSFVPSYVSHGFRKGSGKQNCPQCGGRGH